MSTLAPPVGPPALSPARRPPEYLLSARCASNVPEAPPLFISGGHVRSARTRVCCPTQLNPRATLRSSHRPNECAPVPTYTASRRTAQQHPAHKRGASYRHGEVGPPSGGWKAPPWAKTASPRCTSMEAQRVQQQHPSRRPGAALAPPRLERASPVARTSQHLLGRRCWLHATVRSGRARSRHVQRAALAVVVGRRLAVPRGLWRRANERATNCGRSEP